MESGKRIDYVKLGENELNWVFTEGKNVIISPDPDGIICGLICGSLFGDKIIGTYDGICLTLKNGFDFYKDKIYCYDCEINMPNVKSIGNHYIDDFAKGYLEYSDNMFNIGLYRGISAFTQKYPFGTCHFLYAYLYKKGFELPNLTNENMIPFLHADGFHSNFSNYYENCREWFDYMGCYDTDNPLFGLINGNIGELDKLLNDFRRERDLLKWKTNRDGEDIKIYNKSNSMLYDDERFKVTDSLLYSFTDEYIEKKKSFIRLVANKIGIQFIEENWDVFNDFKVIVFKDETIKPTKSQIKEYFTKYNVLSCCQISTDKLVLTYDKEKKINNNIQLSLF